MGSTGATVGDVSEGMTGVAVGAAVRDVNEGSPRTVGPVNAFRAVEVVSVTVGAVCTECDKTSPFGSVAVRAAVVAECSSVRTVMVVCTVAPVVFVVLSHAAVRAEIIADCSAVRVVVMRNAGEAVGPESAAVNDGRTGVTVVSVGTECDATRAFGTVVVSAAVIAECATVLTVGAECATTIVVGAEGATVRAVRDGSTGAVVGAVNEVLTAVVEPVAVGEERAGVGTVDDGNAIGSVVVE